MNSAWNKLKQYAVQLGKKKSNSVIKEIYPYYRKGGQVFQLYRGTKSNNTLPIPANTVLNIQNIRDFQEKLVVFTSIEAGEYDLILRHGSHALHQNRRFAWAVFEPSGVASSKYIAEKLKLPFGDYGIFGYIGGGRVKDGLYQSGSYINLYKNFDFLTVKIISPSGENLDIREIGLIKKNQLVGLVENNQPKSWEIDSNKILDKLNSVLDKDAYLIYANITPNVADGSSIWLSSITDILAYNSKVILLLKENLRNDITVSNIVNKDNVIFLQPSDYSNAGLLDEKKAFDAIRAIDAIHPQLRGVLVRGMSVANELISNRQFKGRSITYITDFYQVNNGVLEITKEKANDVKNIALHSKLLMIQTQEMRDKIFSLIGGVHPNYTLLPPSLPDSMFSTKKKENTSSVSDQITIGYAGKIMPDWGVEELLTWVYEFNKYSTGKKIKLFIAANKISAPEPHRKEFVSKIRHLIQKSGAEHYTDFNRMQCIQLLEKIDYVWAYRPGFFEENTLELSTKLLEAIAMQQRVICYPSSIHRNELGENYPFYVKDQKDFFDIINNGNAKCNLSKIANKLKEKHAISNVAKRLKNIEPFKIINSKVEQPKICFASHDFKFIDAYISDLKSKGYRVVRDNWEWGKLIDDKQTKYNYEQSDIIFCEWGLANAVWFSQNNVDDKPLYVRVHAQEIRERAQKFGRQINFDKVTKVVFVSQRVCDEYIKLFNIPREKTIVIPNFVLDDEFILNKNQKDDESKVVLGMVGIVPQLKRPDRAISLLESLLKDGINAELRIKGHRPENMEMMKTPSRAKEMEYYHQLYSEIEQKGLSDRVIFDGWGNDVALWYRDVDFILSPSETESFHYALADGVLAGCIPVVWSWSEASTIYPDDWIVDSVNTANKRVCDCLKNSKKYNIQKGRDYIVNKYGKDVVFTQINNLLFKG